MRGRIQRPSFSAAPSPCELEQKLNYRGARANACSHCTVAQRVKSAQWAELSDGDPRLDQAAKREDYPTSLDAGLSWKMAVEADFQPGGTIHRGLEEVSTNLQRFPRARRTLGAPDGRISEFKWNNWRTRFHIGSLALEHSKLKRCAGKSPTPWTLPQLCPTPPSD